MKYLLAGMLCFVAILVVVPTSTIFADGPVPTPADPSLVITPGKVTIRQVQHTIHKVGSKSISPNASTDVQVGGFTIRYSNGAQLGYDQYNNKYVRHYLARTEQ